MFYFLRLFVIRSVFSLTFVFFILSLSPSVFFILFLYYLYRLPFLFPVHFIIRQLITMPRLSIPHPFTSSQPLATLHGSVPSSLHNVKPLSVFPYPRSLSPLLCSLFLTLSTPAHSRQRITPSRFPPKFLPRSPLPYPAHPCPSMTHSACHVNYSSSLLCPAFFLFSYPSLFLLPSSSSSLSSVHLFIFHLFIILCPFLLPVFSLSVPSFSLISLSLYSFASFFPFYSSLSISFLLSFSLLLI